MTVALALHDSGVLYRGGNIRTIDPARPAAEAVATRSGRIVAVGTEPTCRRVLSFDDDQTAGVVELGGRTLLPGFIDAHLHPLAVCYFAYQVDLSEVDHLNDVLDALADRARATAPGEWVVGVQLAADHLRERRLPDIAELDAVGAGRPVVVLLRDGHTSIGNTVALAAAGIRGNRTAPPGGSFERDERGRLTGVCHETATGVLLSSVPAPGVDELASVAKQMFADFAAQGITSLGTILQTDAEGPGGPASSLESVAMMILAEDMPQGNHAILCGDPAKAVDLHRSSALHQPDDNRFVGGVKIFLDGTLGARTACMHHPYADQPGTQGWLRMDPALVAKRMELAHLAGLQICVHAIGDAANDQALALFTDLLARHPPDPRQPPRHRIEHASVLDEAAAERFGELGIVAVVQPSFLRSEAGWLEERLGATRRRLAYPFRTLVDAGVLLAGSSDAPLESTDVLAGIEAAVTRHGFEVQEALTPAQALALYTRNAAIAQRRDHITGTITEGKRADLVILSEDPLAVRADEISRIEVCRTVIGGEVIHRGTDV